MGLLTGLPLVLIFCATRLVHALTPGHHVLSEGCGLEYNWVGHTRSFEFVDSGLNRTYLVHLPRDYSPVRPAPLIVAYHGSGDNPANFEKTTLLSDETINTDMIVAYPLGVNHNWQGPTYATPGVSDKAFTTALVKHLELSYCIDTRRIYATGHSNGGGFVNTLACSPTYGSGFAAFAPVSGAYYTDARGNKACHPSRDLIPLLEIHGGADKTIPYIPKHDGRGGPLPSVPEWLSRWSMRNDCSRNYTETLSHAVYHTSWNCQGHDGALQHYKIEDQGHGWPGRTSRLDTSRVIMNFFRQQNLP